MISFFIWFAALLCPNPNHTADNHGSCDLVHLTTISSADGDTGGETGGIPIPPPPPPSGN